MISLHGGINYLQQVFVFLLWWKQRFQIATIFELLQIIPIKKKKKYHLLVLKEWYQIVFFYIWDVFIFKKIIYQLIKIIISYCTKNINSVNNTFTYIIKLLIYFFIIIHEKIDTVSNNYK